MLSSMTMVDSWSPVMYEMNSFHDHAMVVVLAISSLVLHIFLTVMMGKTYNRFMKSAESLEILWTIVPCVVLVGLASPSLVTLYMSDEMVSPMFTIKVMGHQWYWSYEWSDFWNMEFDSVMKGTEYLSSGEYRLLEVDERLAVPLGQELRLVVSSTDVIHSWSMPTMGLKVDAVPGRINQLTLIPSRVGLSYGQCSEICGSLHSFMPICLEVLTEEEFMGLILK